MDLPREEQRKGQIGPRDRGKGQDEKARRPSNAPVGTTAVKVRSDVESRNRLVQEHLSLVLPVARQYVNRGLTIEDLVGEGNLGLIRAAEAFDPGFGTRFSTYATYWIREAILSALMNTAATIRLPTHVAKLMGRWRRTEKRLRRERGHPPTFEDVATAMGLDRPMQRLVARAHRVSQLLGDDIVTGGASPCFLKAEDRNRPEDAFEHEEEHAMVLQRLERLEVRERTVLVLRYGLAGEPPRTLRDIGLRLGVGPDTVQKIATAAIGKLGGSREPRRAPGDTAYRNLVG